MQEASFVKRFNARVPWIVRYGMVLGVGLVLIKVAIHAMPVVYYGFYKTAGASPDCPWDRLVAMEQDVMRFQEVRRQAQVEISVVDQEPADGLMKVAIDGRTFWIRKEPGELPQDNIVAFLTAEYRWMEEMNPDKWVRKGDVVLDGGAHVGIFTARALRAGASKVIAVEPEPVNIECYRRNFPDEIADGRVVLITDGLWSEETTLKLAVSDHNSGENSVVRDIHTEKTISIPVTTIDRLLSKLGLDRVDFIKLDIEGAERKALEGGLGTLRNAKPRMAIASYHLADDMSVLPALIQRENPSYRSTPGACGPSDYNPRSVIPHMTYWE